MEGTLATEYPSVLLVSCYVFGLSLEHKNMSAYPVLCVCWY